MTNSMQETRKLKSHGLLWMYPINPNTQYNPSWLVWLWGVLDIGDLHGHGWICKHFRFFH